MKSILILITVSMFWSCKKEKNSSDEKVWKVKYELVSNNTASKAVILYRKENGNIVTVGDPSTAATGSGYQQLPWNYEADFSKDAGLAMARALTLSVIDIKPVNSSDKIIARIYVNGKIVSESSQPGVLGINYVLN